MNCKRTEIGCAGCEKSIQFSFKCENYTVCLANRPLTPGHASTVKTVPEFQAMVSEYEDTIRQFKGAVKAALEAGKGIFPLVREFVKSE